jgi:hypothetical protein
MPGSTELTLTPPAGYRWIDRDTDGTYWELLHRGNVAAEVVLDESTGRWLWYVHVPDGCDNGRNPSAAARSAGHAKDACVAIVMGFGDHP